MVLFRPHRQFASPLTRVCLSGLQQASVPIRRAVVRSPQSQSVPPTPGPHRIWPEGWQGPRRPKAPLAVERQLLALTITTQGIHTQITQWLKWKLLTFCIPSKSAGTVARLTITITTQPAEELRTGVGGRKEGAAVAAPVGSPHTPKSRPNKETLGTLANLHPPQELPKRCPLTRPWPGWPSPPSRGVREKVLAAASRPRATRNLTTSSQHLLCSPSHWHQLQCLPQLL